jgi:hypothetical protein
MVSPYGTIENGNIATKSLLRLLLERGMIRGRPMYNISGEHV